MNRFRFPIAVGVTSLALVLILVGIGGLVVGKALANSPFMSAAAFGPGSWGAGGPHGGDRAGWQLPPELAGLGDIPASDRFSHFRNVQVQLTDKDNKPLNMTVVPGTAAAISATSLTVTGNDGTSHTFSLDAKTAMHGTVKQNDNVAAVTINNSSVATAVMVVNGNGFGPRGPFGH